MTQTIARTTEDQIIGDAFSNRKVKGPPPLIDAFARYKRDYKLNGSCRNHVDDVTSLTGGAVVDAATNGKPAITEIISRAVCKKPLYIVTLAKVLPDNTLRHDFVLTTHNELEALRWRNELNENRSFYNSKEVAQVIRREVKPREWKLWIQVSTEEVHLRCVWSNARALFRTSNLELLNCLHRGHTLPQNRLIYLESEQVELVVESVSTNAVSFRKSDFSTITQKTEIRTPSIYYLDINLSSELVVDTRCGVIARHSIQDDKLVLPEKLAIELWLEGIILPLESKPEGKVLVRLTDPELRTRLELSRLKSKIYPYLAPPKISVLKLKSNF